MRSALALVAILFLSATATPQYGTAPHGYYPADYNGAIFTGKFVKGDTDQNVTLTYTKASKVEVFVGRLQMGCKVPTRDGSQQLMNATDFPESSVVTAFYSKVTRKQGGKKIKENQIIAISFAEIDGQRIADERRRIYYCTRSVLMQFRAFGAPNQ